ncbi:MAG: T9SS type A sorting domain-containing protein [Bacteroidota bacterium]
MKKHLLSFVICMTAIVSVNAQSTVNNLKTLPAFKSKSNEVFSNHKTSSAPHSRAQIWSDDFSVPSNWVISSEVPNNQNWVIGTGVPSGGFAIAGIQSTTAANGFALFDSDGMTTNFVNQIGDITTANPIDCSTHPGVLLRFEQFYRRFYDSSFVFVSTDNVNWTKYSVNQGVPVNSYNSSTDGDPNPETVTLNISPVAGNQATVWIRFQFYSPLSLQSGASGWCYAWMVDDVSLEDAPANDMSTDQVWTGDGYSIYPVGQERDVYFAAITTNQGYTTQSNVILTSTVTPGGFNDYSSSVDFTPASSDTIEVNTTFLPSGLGAYTVGYTISCDSVDANPNDNTDSKSFSVHPYQFARDNGNYDGTRLWNGSDAYTMGNYYYIYNATTVASIDVAFAEGSTPNTPYQAKIFSWDGTAWAEIGSSPIQTLGVSDINTTNGPAHFITINLDGPISITDSTEVLATIDSYGLPDTLFLAAGSDLLQPGIKTVYYDPVASTPGWYRISSPNAAMVRLNVNGFVGINETVVNDFKISVFPNPASDQVAVNYTAEKAENISMSLFNNLGQLVYSTDLGNQNAGNHKQIIATENLADGIYTLTLKSGASISVNKIVITH